MTRYCLVLIALCATLPACPAGKSHGSDAIVQPGTHQIVILTPPGRTIRLAPLEQVTLAVRYLDPQGVPVSDAQISFALQGETGGATLAGFHANTDPSGTAELGLTAGAESVIFNVEVTATNALPVHFEVAVSVTGFVNIEVLGTYEGTHSATAFEQVAAELYYGDRCDELNPAGPNEPDRLRTTTDGWGVKLLFENLPADLDYAIALLSTDPEGQRLTWGCADVASAQLLPGATLQLALSSKDLHLDASGMFQVTTTLALTADQADAVINGLAPLTDLGRCPFDPLQRLLDCIVDAVSPDSALDCVPEATDPFAQEMDLVRGALDTDNCRTPQTSQSTTALEVLIREATDATGIAQGAALAELASVDLTDVQTLQLHSRLTLVADASSASYFLWHQLNKVSLPHFAQGAWIQLSHLGGLLLSVSSLEAAYTVGEPTLLSVPPHDVTLFPRRTALAAAYNHYLAPVALPATLPDLLETLLQSVHHPDTLSPVTGCAALDAHICDAVVGQTTCPVDACAQGVALLTDLATQHWSTLGPATEADATFSAQIPLHDPDGDLTVDQLGSAETPVPWTLNLHLGQTWSPPATATFTASRIAPIPQ